MLGDGGGLWHETPIRRALALIAAVSLSCGPANATTALPEWLAGSWAMQDGAVWAEEVWTSARGGIMLGIARRGFGAALDGWNTLKIARKADGVLVLVLQPNGVGISIEYPLVLASGEAVEFANPSARHPQRIRLWREGQLLMSQTSRIDGSDAERMNFRPVAVE